MEVSLEYEEVAKVCEEMLNLSDFPISNRKVRERLGRGSMTDIQQHLKKWTSENASRIEEKMSDQKLFTVDKEEMTVLNNLLNLRINRVTSGFQKEILEWKEFCEDIQDQYKNLKSDKELIEKEYKREIEEKNTTIGELNEQIRTLNVVNTELKNKINEFNAQHEQFIKDIQSKDTEIKRLTDENKKVSDEIVRHIELLSANKQSKESAEILYNETKHRLNEAEQRANKAESNLLEFKLEAEKNINIVKETMRYESEAKLNKTIQDINTANESRLSKLSNDYKAEIDNLINGYEKKIEKNNIEYKTEIDKIKNEANTEKKSLMQLLNNFQKK